MPVTLEKRQQTLSILWFAILLNVVIFFIASVLMVKESQSLASGHDTQSILIIVLTAVGTLFVILSFPVKSRFLRQSVDNQEVGLVQTGYIFAWAMCEAAALVGLIEGLMTGRREHYLLFLIAAVGIVVHFPRRESLEAASYKTEVGS